MIDLGSWKCHFDVSVLPSDDGIFQVKSSSGEIHLGEEDVNNTIVNCFIAKTIGLSLPLHSHCKHLSHG